jgi:hypothetical protein
MTKLARVVHGAMGLVAAVALAACIDEKAPDPRQVEQQLAQPAIGRVEEPQVNDQCDNTFSLPDCRGGYIQNGATCTFPNGETGYCWSEGPRFEDGTWDCNICAPYAIATPDTDTETAGD